MTGLAEASGHPAPDEGARIADCASQMTAGSIAALVAELRRCGYRVIAPVARDGALVLDEIRSVTELPWGFGVVTAPGHYRLVERGDRMLFANAAGPMPWKRYLRPPREKILDADRTPDGGFTVTEPDANDEPPLAFLGVQPCDLRALTILDKVMLAAGTRSPYAVRRSRAFIVAVECTTCADTCFCVSASASQGTNCGPGATSAGTPGAPRYDLLLTEVHGDGGHRPPRPRPLRSAACRRSGSCSPWSAR